MKIIYLWSDTRMTTVINSAKFMQREFLGDDPANFLYVYFLGSADRLFCFRDVHLR